MYIISPAVLNLCVFLCDVVLNNGTENAMYSGNSDYVANNILNSEEDLPFELSPESCLKCNAQWTESYQVQNASSYTHFYLYTRNSGDSYTEVNINDTVSLFNGGFDLSKKTMIVIHGWLNSGTNYMASYVRKAALEAADINVITVDWSGVAMSLLYSRAKSAVTPVGEYTGEFVEFLVTEVGVAPEDIHMVGHSLGAHVCGVTGESVTIGQLSRISGLDPAAPGFTSDTEGRLDVTDADFVDVIHTCIGVAGWYDALGTVDFYPNGGYPDQPGCGVDADCAHDRSYMYFAESLSSRGFIATQCSYYLEYKLGWCDGNDQTLMGEFVDQNATGVYYLYTNSESPFAAWNNSLTVTNDRHSNGLHIKRS